MLTGLVTSVGIALLGQSSPDMAPEQSRWVAYVFAIVLTLAVVAVSFISARRSHKD